MIEGYDITGDERRSIYVWVRMMNMRVLAKLLI